MTEERERDIKEAFEHYWPYWNMKQIGHVMYAPVEISLLSFEDARFAIPTPMDAFKFVYRTEMSECNCVLWHIVECEGVRVLDQFELVNL